MHGFIVHTSQLNAAMEIVESVYRPVIPISSLRESLRTLHPVESLKLIETAFWLIVANSTEDVEWACRIIESGGTCLFVKDFTHVHEIYEWMSTAVGSTPEIITQMFPVLFSQLEGDDEHGWKI